VASYALGFFARLRSIVSELSAIGKLTSGLPVIYPESGSKPDRERKRLFSTVDFDG
jgi:hypothetical protein